MGKKLSGKDLIKLGFPKNNSINITLGQINRYHKRVKKEQILEQAAAVLKDFFLTKPVRAPEKNIS